MRKIWLTGVAWVLCCSAPTFALTPREQGQLVTTANSTPVSQATELELEKIRAEIDKLRVTRKATAWLTAAGTVIGAVVGGLITFAITRMGHQFARAQGERSEQDTKLNRLKLQQERELGREQHNLQLFQNLGHESFRARFAAAAVLLNRLKRSQRPPATDELAEIEKTEMLVIRKVLLAVLKKTRLDLPAI